MIESKKSTLKYDISQSPLAIVNRMHFDQSLRTDAVRSGVTLLEEKVKEISCTDFGVQVEAVGRAGKKKYKGVYLIAADGVHSYVRKVMRKEAVPAHMTHYCDILSLETKSCHFYFGTDLSKGSYGWRFPYGKGSDIGVVDSMNHKKNISSLFDLLNLEDTQKIHGYKIPVWESPLFYDNRIFYVGDAAGQVLPFTYEGIYYAMKSAKILATVIAEDLHPEVYEERWNTLYKKKFSILLHLEKFFLHSDVMIYLMIANIGKILCITKV